MLTNRYKAQCAKCRSTVPAGAGIAFRSNFRWAVTHTECTSAVNVIRIGEKTYTRNVRGLCEDAPCCGCCTI